MSRAEVAPVDPEAHCATYTLTELKEKKRELSEQLADLEVQIYRLETNYLEDTAATNSGNIFRGWDGYLQARARNPQPPAMKKQRSVKDADRLFSLSSATHRESVFGTPLAGV